MWARDCTVHIYWIWYEIREGGERKSMKLTYLCFPLSNGTISFFLSFSISLLSSHWYVADICCRCWLLVVYRWYGYAVRWRENEWENQPTILYTNFILREFDIDTMGNEYEKIMIHESSLTSPKENFSRGSSQSRLRLVIDECDWLCPSLIERKVTEENVNNLIDD